MTNLRGSAHVFLLALNAILLSSGCTHYSESHRVVHNIVEARADSTFSILAGWAPSIDVTLAALDHGVEKPFDEEAVRQYIKRDLIERLPHEVHVAYSENPTAVQKIDLTCRLEHGLSAKRWHRLIACYLDVIQEAGVARRIEHRLEVDRPLRGNKVLTSEDRKKSSGIPDSLRQDLDKYMATLMSRLKQSPDPAFAAAQRIQARHRILHSTSRSQAISAIGILGQYGESYDERLIMDWEPKSNTEQRLKEAALSEMRHLNPRKVIRLEEGLETNRGEGAQPQH